jgi:hypothetical protein
MKELLQGAGEDEDWTRNGGVAGGVAGPNCVQQAILLWTFQMSAHESRVAGVVGEGWVMADEPFAPTIHHFFSKATVSAPLLW